MSSTNVQLPQLGGGLYLTDAGIETTLIYLEGVELPYFAAFHLLKDDAGAEILRRYFRRHAGIAREHGAGFVLESATWRASPEWADKLGYSTEALDAAHRKAIAMLHEIRAGFADGPSPAVVSGCIGPRGDGYDPGRIMGEDEAQAYHRRQVRVLADAGADMIAAITVTNVNEAVGIARAAADVGLPVAISFTVETDGCLPSGETLGEAIDAVDKATANGPAYYMVNCAHPTHFADVLENGWVMRLRGIRANASRASHAELDKATELDAGDPVELGRQYRDIRARFPHINVLGGCCGTDHRHIAAIASACFAA